MGNGRAALLPFPIPHSLFFWGVQPLHRLVEITVQCQRQRIDGRIHCLADRHVVVAPGTTQHPGHHAVLVTRVTDADPQPVELAMSEQTDGVTQAILAAMAAVELEPRRARRQVQLVMRNQQLLRLDLPEPQRSSDRLAT